MKIEKRTEALRVVREMDKVPGVMFGKSIDPVSIQIDAKDLHDLISEYGYTKTFTVKLGRSSHQVYIKEVQFDILKKTQALNVKILKVKAGDTIKANVPLELLGKEAIDKPGIIIQVLSDSVEVEYPVGKGLSSIQTDVSKLNVGETIHVRDLDLPDYLIVHDDPDKMLVSVSEVVYEEETTETETTTESVLDESPVETTEE